MQLSQHSLQIRAECSQLRLNYHMGSPIGMFEAAKYFLNVIHSLTGC
jgi:hypothetical protein